MAQIKITMTIEASAFSLAHAALDVMDAKLRQHGGGIATAKLKKGADGSGEKYANEPWVAGNAATRWCVLYTRIPTNYNNQQMLIVEAATADDAREICIERIGDRGKQFSTYSIDSVRKYEPLLVAGRVVGGAS